MFKNLQLFKIIQANIPHDFSASLEARGFVPCGSTQEKSVGWVPPRGNEHDEFAPVIGGHTILKLTTEVKSVPSDVLQRKVDEQVAHIEQTTGRKPGKKERREIKEDAAGKYITQMMWQMACTKRQWCDFVSFDPRFPQHLQLYVTRVMRDDVMVKSLENEVSQFLDELGAMVTTLSNYKRAA